MSAVRGLLSGSLALVALQAVVGTKNSADRTAGLAKDLASVVERAVSPAVALIPDRRKPTSTAGTAPSSLAGGSGTGTATLQFNTAPLPRPATTTPPLPVIAPDPSKAT